MVPPPPETNPFQPHTPTAPATPHLPAPSESDAQRDLTRPAAAEANARDVNLVEMFKSWKQNFQG